MIPPRETEERTSPGSCPSYRHTLSARKWVTEAIRCSDSAAPTRALRHVVVSHASSSQISAVEGFRSQNSYENLRTRYQGQSFIQQYWVATCGDRRLWSSHHLNSFGKEFEVERMPQGSQQD